MDNLVAPEFLRFLGSLGVGGAIAGLMFMVYRKDSQRWQEQWQGQSETLLRVVTENTKAITSHNEIMRAVLHRLERDAE